ncbi:MULTISPECIES: hypothetical protein [Actinomycetes]|uniref:Uncharacterized protein n=2 Tax=Actinomycetes TaxID=1760 RepID=A0ABP6M632_9MICC
MTEQHPEPASPHQGESVTDMEIDELDAHITEAEHLHRRLSERLEATGRH